MMLFLFFFMSARVCEEKALVREECLSCLGPVPNRVVFYQEMMMRVCYNTHTRDQHLSYTCSKRAKFHYKKIKRKEILQIILKCVSFLLRGVFRLVFFVLVIQRHGGSSSLPRYLEISVFVRGMFRITRAFSRWLFILFGGDQPSIMMMDSLPQSLLFQVPISKKKKKKRVIHFVVTPWQSTRKQRSKIFIA